MAYEKTPPRTRMILLFAGMSALTLVVLHPLFIAYFTTMTVEEQRLKIRELPAIEFDIYREEQLGQLRRRVFPLDTAIQVLAERDRRALGPIVPQPSEDRAALAGWAFAPEYEAPPTPTPVPTRGGEAKPEPTPGEEAPDRLDVPELEGR